MRRFTKRFSRRQLTLLCSVLLIAVAALVGGVLGFEAAAWAGLMIMNLMLLLMLLSLSQRLGELHEIERRRLIEAEAQAIEQRPSRESDSGDERTELLLRRVLAAFEHERRSNARRFEQLAGREAVEEYDPM